MADGLVKRNSESLTTGQQSPENYSVIAQALDLAASIHNRDLTDEEIRFWADSLLEYPASLIEQAFRHHLQSSVYFPKPADIRIWCCLNDSRAEVETELQRTEKIIRESRQARESGGCVSFGELAKGLLNVCEIKPKPESRPLVLTEEARQKEKAKFREWQARKLAGAGE